MLIVKKAVLAFANEALGKFIMTLAPAPPCGPPPTIPLTKVQRDVEKGEKVVNTAAARPLPRLSEMRGAWGLWDQGRVTIRPCASPGDDHNPHFWN